MIGLPRRKERSIGVTWRARSGMDDPARCLLAAIIHMAVRDALYAPPLLQADALAYLHGPNFEADCAWLGLDPAHVRQRLQEVAAARSG